MNCDFCNNKTELEDFYTLIEVDKSKNRLEFIFTDMKLICITCNKKRGADKYWCYQLSNVFTLNALEIENIPVKYRKIISQIKLLK